MIGFSERGSQYLSNGINVAALSRRLFFCLYICSLCHFPELSHQAIANTRLQISVEKKRLEAVPS